jgi:hypothetical protein
MELVNQRIARKLVDRRIAIFPCDQSKKPKTKRGFKQAEVDASHWDRHPEDLIGLPTSRFWVLDLDVPLDPAISALEEATSRPYSEIESSCGCIIETPSGGRHLYFAREPGVAIRTAAGDIGPGIDTRGHDADGNPTGYVIAPGCQLVDRRRYKSIKGDFSC